MPPRSENSPQQQLELAALCAALLRELGGARNIERLGHCTTRLRVRVYTTNPVNVSALKAHSQVFNVISQGPELQLVINGDVDLLCRALQQILGLGNDHDEDLDYRSALDANPFLRISENSATASPLSATWASLMTQEPTTPTTNASQSATNTSEVTASQVTDLYGLDLSAIEHEHGAQAQQAYPTSSTSDLASSPAKIANTAETANTAPACESAPHTSFAQNFAHHFASGFALVTSMLSAAIMPLFGFLAATGFLSTLTGILVFADLLESSDRLYSFFNATFVLLLNFLPVLIGYTSARWFRSSPMVSIILGLCLVPSFYQQLSAMMPLYDRITTPFLQGLQELLHSRFDFTTYNVSVLPILIANALNARLERFTARIIPQSVQYLVTPLICLCFCVPILILFIAPLFTALGYVLSGLILSLYEHSPWLLGFVIGSLWELFVCFGLHWITTPMFINNLAFLGYDMLIAMSMAPTFATAGAMAGNYLYQRHLLKHHPEALADPNEVALTRNASVMALFLGITEPVIYTYLVQRSKLFILVCCIGGIGGLLIAISGVRMYSLSLSSTFAFVLAYRPGADNSIWPLLWFVLISFGCYTVSMFTSFFWRRKERQHQQAQALSKAQESITANTITAVCRGSYLPLNQVNDPIFSSLMLGDGYAIKPEEDTLYAPCDGILSEDITFAHAVGIKGPLGTEILLHAGINTVRLEGKFFKLLKQPGEAVKRGEAVLQFERKAIKQAGYDPTIIVICTLPDKVHLQHNEELKADTEVNTQQPLLILEPPESVS